MSLEAGADRERLEEETTEKQVDKVSDEPKQKEKKRSNIGQDLYDHMSRFTGYGMPRWSGVSMEEFDPGDDPLPSIGNK
jgi:hypothetical protein